MVETFKSLAVSRLSDHDFLPLGALALVILGAPRGHHGLAAHHRLAIQPT